MRNSAEYFAPGITKKYKLANIYPYATKNF